MEAFPALMALSDPELVEPLALLFMHFDPDDLEDADALAAVIETLEPPADLGEAVQDTVRALLQSRHEQPKRFCLARCRWYRYCTRLERQHGLWKWAARLAVRSRRSLKQQLLHC